MANKKNAKQSQNNDAAALGNDDVSSEVEVRSGELTQDNNNNLHNDPDFYIGQKPDEIK
ncbi:hypothetical protein AWH56_002340 [Anaerobacillus isosaccharinicus]|uniref:DUF4025 domain-containing protein n=1 Tax=Anaerobacillus isosaccharinicus TaxID=1532552 RepID=A0A7S7L8V3_9BACI|nr:hypothetical protein [Anaerobacillus isosaccharinicus]MBA5585116.1 hypothetical protein [Anaerobacillus isosaccharinicus]QOY36541.1 hypothetical protein AWH56_002340 [Anaerobacillus isosaccharinicus]